MPVIDGKKFACESCIRGHRVSTCQHDDRPLKLIPPKGRPVKQCEHCRTARKSKSHHGKCDCSSKREKKEKVEAKTERGCRCHEGETCNCSLRSESVEVRIGRSLRRPEQSVRSKSAISTSAPEAKLTQFTNGHHKPIHRSNNLAHTSGRPYKIPRFNSLNSRSSLAQTHKAGKPLRKIPRGDTWTIATARMTCDLQNLPVSSHANSAPHEDSHKSPNEVILFDLDGHFGAPDEFKSSTIHLETVSHEEAPLRFFEMNDSSGELGCAEFPSGNLSSVKDSPRFAAEYDALFSPSDLPLISPDGSALGQTTSNSGESNRHSQATGSSFSIASHDSETDMFSETFFSDAAGCGPAASVPVAISCAVLDDWSAAQQMQKHQLSASPSPPSLSGSYIHPKDTIALDNSLSRQVSSLSAISSISQGSCSGTGPLCSLLLPVGLISSEEVVLDDWAWNPDCSNLQQHSTNMKADCHSQAGHPTWLY